jgi:hypothetical protein
MRRRSVLLLLFLAAPAWAQAPPAGLPSSNPEHGVSVVAAASLAEVTVGQKFIVDVRASGPPGTTFSFPTSFADGPVEMTASNVPGLPFGIQRYDAMAVGLEPVQVPAVTVAYRLPDGRSGSVASAPIPLRFVSLLPRNPEQQKLDDVRPPLPLGIAREFWIAIGILAALLVALVVWLFLRKRPATAPVEAGAPVESAEAQARRELDALGTRGLVERGEYRPFYIELAEIAKRYLERRLGAPVLEMTTSEAVVFLRRHEKAHDLAPVLRDVSEAADLVKFARGTSAADDARRHLLEVRRLVDGVEERLRPPAPQPAGAAAPEPPTTPGPTSLS